MEPTRSSSDPLSPQGPLNTAGAPVPTPTTVFRWASAGHHDQPAGPGECAWADRAPRGTEIRKGDTGIIFGYLNQVANLPAGRFAEIGVYRDPVFDNDLNVTQIVGFVFASILGATRTSVIQASLPPISARSSGDGQVPA